jgi:hypothetical protein
MDWNALLQTKPEYRSTLSPDLLAIFRPLDAEYPYNSQIAERIIKDFSLTVNETERRNLDTYVYVARDNIRAEKDKAHAEQMLKDGWQYLTAEIIKDTFSKYGKDARLQVSAKMDSDWLTVNIDKVYKPFVSTDGNCYLMKPRASAKGWSYLQFRNSFCKVLNK